MDNLFELPELPEPNLYAHELILNGGGVWIGVNEKGICEQSHVPGETGEEIRSYYNADQMRAYARAAVEAEREACAQVGFRAAMNGIEVAAAIRERGKS